MWINIGLEEILSPDIYKKMKETDLDLVEKYLKILKKVEKQILIYIENDKPIILLLHHNPDKDIFIIKYITNKKIKKQIILGDFDFFEDNFTLVFDRFTRLKTLKAFSLNVVSEQFYPYYHLPSSIKFFNFSAKKPYENLVKTYSNYYKNNIDKCIQELKEEINNMYDHADIKHTPNIILDKSYFLYHIKQQFNCSNVEILKEHFNNIKKLLDKTKYNVIFKKYTDDNDLSIYLLRQIYSQLDTFFSASIIKSRRSRRSNKIIHNFTKKNYGTIEKKIFEYI